MIDNFSFEVCQEQLGEQTSWQTQLSKQAAGFDCTCAQSTCTLAVLELAESELTSGVLKDL